MNFKKQRKKRIDIADSGALSDLAFLLIVFFIVIAVFNANKGFMLSLPRKNSSKILNVNDIVKVTLTEDNRLTYKDNAVTNEQLKEIVKERQQLRPNLTFLLKVHPEAKYQFVVNVLDLIRELGVDNFSFSMLKERD